MLIYSPMCMCLYMCISTLCSLCEALLQVSLWIRISWLQLLFLFKDDCRILDLEDDVDINLLIQIHKVTKHQKSQDQTGH